MSDYKFLNNIIQRTAQTALKNESDDIARLAAKKAEQEALESGADILGQSPSMAKMHEGFQSSARESDVIHALNDPLSARNSASAFGEAIPEALPVLPRGNGAGAGGRQGALEEAFGANNARNSASVFEEAGLGPLPLEETLSTAVLPRGRGIGVLPRGAANVDLNSVSQQATKVTPEVFDKMSFLQKYGRKSAIGAGVTGGILSAGYALSPDSPSPTASPGPQPASEQPNTVVPPKVVAPQDQGGRLSTSVSQKTMARGSDPVDQKTAMEAVLAAQANQFKDTEAALKEAQNRENSAIFANQLGKSANLIGSSIAGVNPTGQELFDDNIKQAGQVVAQQQARMEKANNDPKSGLSVALRQQLKSLGVNAPEAMSATDLMKVLPGAQSLHKANEDRALRAEDMQQKHLDRQAMLQMSKDKKSMVDKEQSKEDAKIRTENRKERRQIENDMKSTEALINELNTTKDMFEKYSKSQILGTGPIATLGGLTPKIMQKSEDLDAQFKKQNLDTMVKMFAGMSKAVDTNNERRAFESAQASMTNDDKTNARLIKEKIDAAKSMLQKQKDAVAKYDRYGDFTQGEDVQQNSQPSTENKQLNTSPDEDAEAVAWAKANSTNPKAKEILRLHGL